MAEERKDKLDLLLAEVPVLFIAVLWASLAVMTQNGFIGFFGLAILYRRYAKKERT